MRLAHVWSSDMGIAAALPQLRPFVAGPWRVYAICPDGPRLGDVMRAGVTWLPWSLSRRSFDPGGDLRAVHELFRYLRSERFDLVHTHNIKAGLLGRVIAGVASRARVVHTMHGMPFSRESPPVARAGHAALEWTASRFADRILVQSQEDEHTMRALVSERKLVRIGNGVPLERFDPARVAGGAVRGELGLRPDEVLFAYGGRLVREKGVLDLLEAYALARAEEPRIRLALAGPTDRDKADSVSDEELARGRALGAAVLGERGDMPEVLAAADVAVLPSWREGLPRFLMEAAAMGKPLLASDVRGCREVVEVPAGGRLVPPRSPAALAAAMVALARDPDARRAQGAHNQRRAVAEFDLRRVVEKVDRVYRELLS